MQTAALDLSQQAQCREMSPLVAVLDMKRDAAVDAQIRLETALPVFLDIDDKMEV